MTYFPIGHPSHSCIGCPHEPSEEHPCALKDCNELSARWITIIIGEWIDEHTKVDEKARHQGIKICEKHFNLLSNTVRL